MPVGSSDLDLDSTSTVFCFVFSSGMMWSDSVAKRRLEQAHSQRKLSGIKQNLGLFHPEKEPLIQKQTDASAVNLIDGPGGPGVGRPSSVFM